MSKINVVHFILKITDGCDFDVHVNKEMYSVEICMINMFKSNKTRVKESNEKTLPKRVVI